MGFVEPGNMVDIAHPSHLGTNRFEDSGGKAVLFVTADLILPLYYRSKNPPSDSSSSKAKI
jgi:hypothetical protein